MGSLFVKGVRMFIVNILYYQAVLLFYSHFLYFYICKLDKIAQRIDMQIT